MGIKELIFRIQFLAILLLLLVNVSFVGIGNCEDEALWHVHDVIYPTLDSVRWSEEGMIAAPPEWIFNGLWVTASMRQSLVAENDIFVSTYEQINWELMQQYVSDLYEVDFSSFDEFDKALESDPGRWLEMSWGVDTDWYGVPSTKTKIDTGFDQNTSKAELWIWFHITRIPEYLVSEKKVENWLTGFDMTPISIGNLERWEFYEDWASNGIAYELNFKAPSNLLSQKAGNYTFRIDVSSYYQGYTFDIQQSIDVVMPSDTEAKVATPTGNCVFTGNMATFLIAQGEVYPESFTVVSGPPSKSIGEAFIEAASVWAFTPAGWAALGSVAVLTLTGIRGRTLWKRNKMYHRLYKSMVTIYDLRSRDQARFVEEMDIVSKSIFRMLIQDEITEDQFEKLLKGRDDLLESSARQNSSSHST